MNLAAKTKDSAKYMQFLVVPVFVFLLFGCGCQPSPKLVDETRYREFIKAGPVVTEIDNDKLALAKVPDDMYKVVPGDVIELEMPAVIVSSEPGSLDDISLYHYRIDRQGKINIPVVGKVEVSGLDLSQIESKLYNLFYPQYCKSIPSLVARVSEYYTQTVAITGAVGAPGQYKLKSDEMSLVSLIMTAGGIDTADGADLIRITHAGNAGKVQELTLPVKGLNVPFADVALRHGDRIEVRRLNPEIFSVIGLVNRPGSFPYTPGARYNILQTLAFAGGADDIADPKFIKVFRQRPDGTLIDATFKLDAEGIANANAIEVKPGDIIAAVKTNRTEWNEFLDEFISIRAGVDVRYLNRADY